MCCGSRTLSLRMGTDWTYEVTQGGDFWTYMWPRLPKRAINACFGSASADITSSVWQRFGIAGRGLPRRRWGRSDTFAAVSLAQSIAVKVNEAAQFDVAGRLEEPAAVRLPPRCLMTLLEVEPVRSRP